MLAAGFRSAAAALRGAALAVGIVLMCQAQAQQADVGQLLAEGAALITEGKAEEAAAKFGQALEAEPKNASARYWMGEAHLALGHKAEARAAFAASLEADPKHPYVVDARMRLADLAAEAAVNQVRELPKPGSELRDCPECPAMVVLPPGQFEMRTPPASWGRFDYEGFVRKVNIREPFAIGKFEVTFDEWDTCVREKQCAPIKDEGWGRGRRPAIFVSWMQADGYTQWLSKKTGRKYRLPTDAEWEYAARAGADKSRFFGLSPEKVCEYGNMHDLTAKKAHGYEWEHVPCDDKYPVTAPVGSFKPNAFGLYDMLGNAWEWTLDCQNATWRGAPQDASAWPGGDCSERAFRGGSWLSHTPVYLRQSDYFKYVGAKNNDLGFRVARTLP